jgi:hypothetical protein
MAVALEEEFAWRVSGEEGGRKRKREEGGKKEE